MQVLLSIHYYATIFKQNYMIFSGSLPPSRRRSLFVLSSCMIIFSSKVYNILPIIPVVKASVSDKVVGFASLFLFVSHSCARISWLVSLIILFISVLGWSLLVSGRGLEVADKWCWIRKTERLRIQRWQQLRAQVSFGYKDRKRAE